MEKSKTIKRTKSLCNICLKEVPAVTFEKDGKIYLEKNCAEHGKFTLDHTWDDPEIYRSLTAIAPLDAEAGQVAAALTNRCNLNCPLCYAKANDIRIEDLSLESLDKIKKFPVVFLTGGEPTIRKDLPQIIRTLKKNGQKVVMFSNGIRLADPEYAKKMKKAGLDCVILQFDATDDASYEHIRGQSLLKTKKTAIKNMQAVRLPVYLYCAMVRGKSFERMETLFPFFDKFSVIKAISVNPLWRLGRYDKADFVPSSEILDKVSKINGLRKKDWIESTRLLCNLDKLISIVSPRKRIFCKCNLKCMVFRYKKRNIPITEIFNTRKINRKIEKAYKKKSRLLLFSFLAYFFVFQVLINFFINKNFRLLTFRMIKNLKYFGRKEKLLFSPFHFITISTFPALGSLDFDFIDNCNFNAVSSEDFNFDPACVHRIKALKRRESKEDQSLN